MSETDPESNAAVNTTIRLDQFLKLTGLVGTGGQAKLAIQAGEVLVNGQIETRRARQLRAGDSVVWGDDEYEVTSASSNGKDIGTSS